MTLAVLFAAALYVGVPLTGENAGQAERYETREAIPGGETNLHWKTDALLFRLIPASNGPVRLGDDRGGEGSGRSVHDVEITEPFYLGVYELTAAQWIRLMGGNRRQPVFRHDGINGARAMSYISHADCRGDVSEGVDWPRTGHHVTTNSLMGVLRRLSGGKLEFDLPTEAQWEYACRAGTTTDFNNGSNLVHCTREGWKTCADRSLDRLGRYSLNGGMRAFKDYGKEPPHDADASEGIAVVGSYQPNAWGLYDMHGNVYECCLDWFSAKLVPEMCGKDPKGPLSCKDRESSRRVTRGGSWWNYVFGGTESCLSAARHLGDLLYPWTPHVALGVRLCLPAAVRTKVSLPGYVTSHMVLQRGVSVPVAGRAGPGASVSVRFAGKTQTVTADENGAWRVVLGPLEASAEPRTLTVAAGADETIVLEDVLVGDVYFLTGSTRALRRQLRKARSADEKALAASARDCANVRVLTLSPFSADYPAPSRANARDFSVGARGWHRLVDASGPEPVVDTSSSLLAFAFAKRRTAEEGVPVGVAVLCGSLSLEALADARVLRTDPDLADLSAKVDRCRPETEIGAKAYADSVAALRAWMEASAAELDAGREISASQPQLPSLRETGLCTDFNGVVAALGGLAVRHAYCLTSERPSERDAIRLKYDVRVDAVRRSMDGVFGTGKTQIRVVADEADLADALADEDGRGRE